MDCFQRNPIVETKLFSYPVSLAFRGPPLDFETVWNGDCWYLQIALDMLCLIFFYLLKKSFIILILNFYIFTEWANSVYKYSVLYCGLNSVMYSVCTVQSTVQCIIHCTVQCTVQCNVQFTVQCTVQCTVQFTVQCTV